ncbi:LysR family transcriptional regulator [Photobacterium aquimaris]|uniref:Chromosome replication initiation inhibitor protein n=1 Tax=Photobacterium aquimaris TaxID=512643 RepID=A0A1Y6L1Z6_9GAMM|nr:LysR family transcriptional regulator [Photobacterium aquimaris]SMY16658.1 chromosome replication initiation inhibitor protein [Photobacterium aquimaris]
MHTLEQLNAFIMVYEQGSYSAAAKLLGKSRTTVRELVITYEDTVGYSLFVIDGRKAVPSDKAHQLYFHAKVVEKQNRDLHCYSQALFEQEVHTINIVHDVIVPLILMCNIEQKIKSTYSYLTINWLHRTRQEALIMLQDGEADLAIMPDRGMLFPEAEMTWVTLGSLHLKCYAGKNSPLLMSKKSHHHDTEVTIHHLQNETQYITENFFSMNIGFAKVSPKMQIVSNNDLLCELLKYNGWAAMPEEYMRNHLKSGDLVEVNIKEMSNSRLISLNIYFMVGKDTQDLFKDTINDIVETAKSSLQ